VVQPGLASDAPGYGGADEDDSPSRGGVDAAGLEEHSSDSSNEEPAADLKGYLSRRVIISWDLYGGPPSVVYAWAHHGAHVYEHHVNYDDTRRRRWHDLGNYGAGHPRGDAAAGALLAGAIKIESKRGLLGHAAVGALLTGCPPGDDAASALSTGANDIKSKHGLLGHAAAGALSTGAITIESTGRPPDDAATGVLSAGAIKIESKRGLLGHAAPSPSALSAGAIIKIESTGCPPDNAAADTLSAGANELESKCGLLGHAAADALLTGRPPGNGAADALSAGATRIEGTGRPPGGAAGGALSACVTKLKGTHHSISDVALTRSRQAPPRSRPAPTRSRARAARSAMRPPTRARPMAHNLSLSSETPALATRAVPSQSSGARRHRLRRGHVTTFNSNR